jgi:hypothetical protein
VYRTAVVVHFSNECNLISSNAAGACIYDPLLTVPLDQLETLAVAVGTRACLDSALLRFEKLLDQSIGFAASMDRRSVSTRIRDSLARPLQMLRVPAAFFQSELRCHTHTHFFVCVFFMFFFFIFYTGLGFC